MGEPYRVLLASLAGVVPGAYFTADDWHQQAHDAGLKSAEKGAVHQQAIDDGYLVRVIVPIGNRTAAVQVPSTIPSRKSGGVQLHIRTRKPLPGQPTHERHHEPEQIAGQLALVEVTA